MDTLNLNLTIHLPGCDASCPGDVTKSVHCQEEVSAKSPATHSPRFLILGHNLREWMIQDIGENSPGFEEKFLERSRILSQTVLSILRGTDDPTIHGFRWLNAGYALRQWMSQDIGENTPGFEEKYVERCRTMGRIIRSILSGTGDSTKPDTGGRMTDAELRDLRLSDGNWRRGRILADGVFIPFTPNGGEPMRELNRFLHRYCYLAEGESIPERILYQDPNDFALMSSLCSWLKQNSPGLGDEELAEWLLELGKHLSRTQERIRRRIEEEHMRGQSIVL